MSRARNDRRLAQKFAQKTARAERGLIAPRLRALKAQAEASRGYHHDALVAGWSFVLTIGSPTGSEGDAETAALIESLRETGVAPDRDGAAGEYHHFSARPVPIGRPVCDEDWFNLGYALEAIGVPADTQQAADAQIERDPDLERHAVHFVWRVENSALN